MATNSKMLQIQMSPVQYQAEQLQSMSDVRDGNSDFGVNIFSYSTAGAKMPANKTVYYAVSGGVQKFPLAKIINQAAGTDDTYLVFCLDYTNGK